MGIRRGGNCGRGPWAILLFSSISLHWSLRKAFLSPLTILWNSAFRCLYLCFSPLLFASLLFINSSKAMYPVRNSKEGQKSPQASGGDKESDVQPWASY